MLLAACHDGSAGECVCVVSVVGTYQDATSLSRWLLSLSMFVDSVVEHVCRNSLKVASLYGVWNWQVGLKRGLLQCQPVMWACRLMWLDVAQSHLIARYTSRFTSLCRLSASGSVAKLQVGVEAVGGWVLTSCYMSHPPQRNTCLSRPLLQRPLYSWCSRVSTQSTSNTYSIKTITTSQVSD